MSRKLFIAVLFLLVETCFSQTEYPRPTFPDVFQTEMEGTFVENNRVMEMDADMYFDKENNRAALFIKKEGQSTQSAYNFDTDESIFIDGNDCEVGNIPDNFPFFPYTVVGGKKKMSSAEEAFFFTKSELLKQTLTEGDIPTLIYKITTDVPRYRKKNCDITHIFSKPDFELSSCKEGLYCASTLLTISVRCKNEKGDIDMDHLYRFSRFESKIEDESVFLPPPGIYCPMKSSKEMPRFPSYFSFIFDILEKPTDAQSSIFKTHRELWLDTEYRIVRIDEFDSKGLLYSSKIFDQGADVAFSIIPSIPSCYVGLMPNDFSLATATRLPKVFFIQNDSSVENAVYVGKRKVSGFDYEVWSLRWQAVDSRIVEEIYFLEISRNEGLSPGDPRKKPFLQASHINTYTYRIDGESNQYKLDYLNNYFINNYKTKPKEWYAFDVASCFNNTAKKEFSLKIEGASLVKGSQTYRAIIEILYNKIIKACGVSVVRINELTGIFDGVHLKEIRGSILDNSETSGWPKSSKNAPGMDKTFELLEKAVSADDLSFTFKGEDDKEHKIKVVSVEAVENIPDVPTKCFSGVVLAAVSLILLLIGVTFGISGYYVFLKKRRQLKAQVQMTELRS